MKIIKIIFILALSIFLLSSDIFADSNFHQKVLVINSYHEGYLWSDKIMVGLQSILSKRIETDIYYEYMDTKRVNNETYFSLLESIYKLKYKHSLFDVILVSDDNALNFTLKNHFTIFNDAPIVFCGINNFNDDMLQGHENVTGVIEKYDPLNTIKAIEKIFPNKKHYIAITDKTESGLIDRKLLEEAINKMETQKTFEFWHNYGYNELMQNIQQAPKDSVIILTDFNRDKNNLVISRNMIISLLKRSPVPVFGRQEWLLNHGLFGGMVVSGFHQGETMAKMAVRVLDGEKISSIPVIKKSPNHYIFYYNYMKKFNISKSVLPDDSIILNEPISLYDFYLKNKTLILSLVTGIFLLITIIFYINYLKVKKIKRKVEHKNFLLKEEITLRKKVEAKILELSRTDDLTQIYNRRRFMELAEQEFNRKKRHGQELSLMLIDVDDFKSINDTYGHHMGDKVLQDLCKTGLKIIRSLDIFGRIGGEEFAMLLPETDLAKAKIVAKRFLDEIEKLRFFASNESFSITISIGLTVATDQINTIENFLKLADRALYLAKENGKNRYEIV